MAKSRAKSPWILHVNCGSCNGCDIEVLDTLTPYYDAERFGIRIVGSTTGIITVLTFVGLPFYLHMAQDGFRSVPTRLENVSRSLGATVPSTFAHVTFPLAWRSMVVGMIMCCARALSEFGAVVVVAYHPMIAPVLIYERFETFGLKYARPVAVWLVAICLVFFLILHVILRSTKEKKWLG